MVNLRVSLLILAGFAFTGALSGCDTDEGGQVQAQGDITALGGLFRDYAGEPMPEAELTDPSGAKVALSSFAGKPVLLNLWATWCAPCIAEMPMLDALAGEMGDRVEILTVSQDLQPELIAPFFAERQLTNLPQWNDKQLKLSEDFGGGGGLPLTILYDAQGREIWRLSGPYEWDGEEARALIMEALPAAPSQGEAASAE